MALTLEQRNDYNMLLDYARSAVAVVDRVCPAAKSLYIQAQNEAATALQQSQAAHWSDAAGVEAIKDILRRANTVCDRNRKGQDTSVNVTTQHNLPPPQELPPLTTSQLTFVNTGGQQGTPPPAPPPSSSSWIWWLVGGGLLAVYLWKKKK